MASMKSFVRTDGADAKKVQDAKDDDPGNPRWIFTARSDATTRIRARPTGERALSQSQGQRSQALFGGHILMENRNGLCADFAIHNPIAQGEPAMPWQQLTSMCALPGHAAKTVGADKAIIKRRSCRVRERTSPLMWRARME